MSSKFSAGLDLGKQSDFTALIIAERTGGLFRKRRFHVRYAHRWRGVDYSQLVGTICGILSQRPFRDDICLQIDATGVGGAVLEMFDQARGQGLLRCEITPVIFSAAIEANPKTNTVPKRDLVTRVEVLLAEKRLTFAPDLALARPIQAELKNYQGKIGDSGRATFEAGSGHDDLVTALALAVYETAPVMVFTKDFVVSEESDEPANAYGIAPPDSWDDDEGIQRKLAQGERRGLVLSNGEWQPAKCHGESVVALGDRFWCAPGNHWWGEQPATTFPGAPTYADFFGD